MNFKSGNPYKAGVVRFINVRKLYWKRFELLGCGKYCVLYGWCRWYFDSLIRYMNPELKPWATIIPSRWDWYKFSMYSLYLTEKCFANYLEPNRVVYLVFYNYPPDWTWISNECLQTQTSKPWSIITSSRWDFGFLNNLLRSQGWNPSYNNTVPIGLMRIFNVLLIYNRFFFCKLPWTLCSGIFGVL